MVFFCCFAGFGWGSVDGVYDDGVTDNDDTSTAANNEGAFAGVKEIWSRDEVGAEWTHLNPCLRRDDRRARSTIAEERVARDWAKAGAVVECDDVHRPPGVYRKVSETRC